MDPRLATLGGAALLGIGAGAIALPRTSSRAFGIAADGPAVAYVRATGARDAILGAMILWQLARAEPRGAATTLRFTTLAAASDALAVASTRGARRSRLVLHVGGLAAVLVAAALLDAGPADVTA